MGQGTGAAGGEGAEDADGAEYGQEGCGEVRRLGESFRVGILADCLLLIVVARYANDKEMNDELRAVERADDPAAAFLTVRARLCIIQIPILNHSITSVETQIQGSTETKVHGPARTAEPIQHLARIPLGWCR